MFWEFFYYFVSYRAVLWSDGGIQETQHVHDDLNIINKISSQKVMLLITCQLKPPSNFYLKKAHNMKIGQLRQFSFTIFVKRTTNVKLLRGPFSAGYVEFLKQLLILNNKKYSHGIMLLGNNMFSIEFESPQNFPL